MSKQNQIVIAIDLKPGIYITHMEELRIKLYRLLNENWCNDLSDESIHLKEFITRDEKGNIYEQTELE